MINLLVKTDKGFTLDLPVAQLNVQMQDQGGLTMEQFMDILVNFRL